MPNLALELAQQSAALGVKSTYGEQRDVDGVSITPVALVWYGFGAGTSAESDGGGGGENVNPLLAGIMNAKLRKTPAAAPAEGGSPVAGVPKLGKGPPPPVNKATKPSGPPPPVNKATKPTGGGSGGGMSFGADLQAALQRRRQD